MMRHRRLCAYLLRSRPCFRYMSQVKIGFATDIEGNLRYWRRYLRRSEVLNTRPDGSIELREHCHFVYGGDVCDRGPGDLRLMRDLLCLKERYPKQVHLLLGNRDINKLRMLAELHPSQTHTGRVYWLRDAPDMSTLSDTKVLSEDDRLVLKVQWMLANTMGAPDAFSHRQRELQELGVPADDVSTARSFREMLAPEGEMRRYLTLGQLGAVIGDCLFVHGALHSQNIGYLPCDTEPSGYRVVSDVRQWIAELNTFKDRELAQLLVEHDYSSSQPWSASGGYSHSEPASRLMQYGMGWAADGSVVPTVIYTNYLDKSGKVCMLTKDVLLTDGQPSFPAETLVRIRAVLTGHQPHGDAPLVIAPHVKQTNADRDNQLHMIVGDTSYAHNALWADIDEDISVPGISEDDAVAECSDDMRGAAVAEIAITQKHESRSAVAISGVLNNGLEYCYDALAEDDIGTAVHAGHVKAVLYRNEKKYFLITESEGRKIVNRIIRSV